MGRPTIIDDAQLLEAARRAFLAKGVSATTAEVARLAGISQASIFKRYKTKHELFLAAMKAEGHRLMLADQLRRRAHEVGFREAMTELGAQLIELVGQILPLALVAWSNRGAFGESGGKRRDPNPFGDAEEVIRVIADEMKAGRLRNQDPWRVLRAFIAAVQHYALVSTIWRSQPGPQLSAEDYMRGFVDILWTGVGPPAPRQKGKRR